jgi:hypothetical protein
MRSKLIEARDTRGWSQTRLISELERRGRANGVPVMSRASLKTSLSRWENGHAVPDRQYRRLLREIYGLTDAELGFEKPTGLDDNTIELGAELRARVAASARVDGALVKVLQDQTDNIRRLDRQLGAPVLLDQMQAHMATLTQLLHYSVLDSTRLPLAAALADAAALAGWQALDVGAVSRAWEHHETAATAGRIAGQPALLAHARGQQAYALLEIGRADDALSLVRDARREAGRRIPARLVSWLCCTEAEVAAAAGLESESRHVLDKADAVLPPGSGDDPELPYVSLDQHHLVRWRGSTLARLGDHEAVADLGRALSTVGPEYVRAQTGLHVDLAQAPIAADAADAAEEHIATARGLASQVGSVRQLRRLARVAAAA